ncbi:hypothetical protein [Lacimicrobium sp. SS2-24]|uniref:hypothetical protein n=1 Tax=Lacimicrobium sp. SS2-24 TaxID=2005569 RepID=UPI00113244FC|nr:hypothetical protein [Lacimicrobium sp. SS2-24]
MIILFFFSGVSAEEGDKYLVFIGGKISIKAVEPEKDEVPFDSQFRARYKVLETYRGSYSESEIEFTVFDHYGKPPFSKYEYVLLYLEKHEGKYYHSKYQFTPLYKTKDGRWAGAYATYDYTHSYNENTTIKPEIIEFANPVVIDIGNYDKEDIEHWFPEPYYKIEGQKAIAVYGNYIDELFRLKQSGVLKARGDFQ